jgi:hypothetical protein
MFRTKVVEKHGTHISYSLRVLRLMLPDVIKKGEKAPAL